jgi:para-nitrobenzyl esterase
MNATAEGTTRPARAHQRGRLTRCAGPLGVVVLFGAACTTPPAADVPARGATARTSSGVVSGAVSGTVRRFRGIPYAAPPVGPLRWRSPQPAPRWTGSRPATRSGPSCAQGDPAKPGAMLAGSSEDCLSLDVVAPRTGGRRPVMVWVHGGGNTSGSGSDYDAARMAARGGVVVVTINYRLGVFGFLGHPGLPGSGTFALQDQQAALRWVRANAAAFGGDPHDVTMFGESAGAVDICAQLTSPQSAGLFDRAILESGSCLTRVPSYAGLDRTVHLNTKDFWVPASSSEATGAAFATTGLRCTGAGAITCLRGKSPAALLGAVTRTGAAFDPAYDTTTLPEDPAPALRRGRIHRVPVLSGNNHDEARLTTMIIELLAGKLTPDTYRAALRSTFGRSKAEAIEHHYPVPAGGDAGLAFATMDTDRVFVCPQLQTSQALARRTRTYGFEFAEPSAPTLSPYYGARPPGAAHTSELASLFDLRNGGPYQGTKKTELTPAERELGNTMIDTWTAFARTGRTAWPAYPTVQSLAPQHIGPVDAWKTHHCDFWSTSS